MTQPSPRHARDFDTAALARRPTRGKQAASRSPEKSRGSLETRTTVLETRWEDTFPTLATKADVRAESRGAETRMTLWIFGGALALAALLVPLLTANTARIDKLDTKIETSADRINARVDRLEEKIDARFEKMDARFDELLGALRENKGH